MNTFGLPDGIHPLDLPGNGPASELQSREWELNREAVLEQARIELIAQCGVKSPAHSAYLDYVSARGICTRTQFVLALERANAELWLAAVDRVWRSQFSSGDAA